MNRAARAALRLAGASLLVGVNLWLAQSTFVPVARDGRPVEYVLVSASRVELVASIAIALGALSALHFLITRPRASSGLRQGASGAGLFSDERSQYLRVFGWTALSLIPLLNLAGPFAGAWPAATYVLFELRFVWWALVAAVVAARIRPSLFVRGIRERWAVAALATAAVAWTTWSTPGLRFSGVLHGDEPKYIRYCENFFQGRGFDIAGLENLQQREGHDEPAVLHNVTLMLRAIPQEASSLAQDLRRSVGLPARPRLVAQPPTEAMVFLGKHPGTAYQLHNPGLSFLLFPAYYLDRRATGSGAGYRGEFPAEMPAVHVMLLALYAAYAIALYGLLETYVATPESTAPGATASASELPSHSSPRAVALMLALIGVLVLPAAAFAFQIYPEVPAGIAIFMVTRRLVAERRPTVGESLAYGALAGFLPWLHVRFLLASIVLLAWSVLKRNRGRAARVAFACGALAGIGGLSFYTYHLTGSVIPASTYGNDVPLSFARTAKGIPAFAFDRIWGLLPHTPIYLLAFPGLAAAWRRNRATTLGLLAMLAAVVIPAAGHGFWAGGGTPGRYLVAAAPLLLLWVADAVTVWRQHRAFAATLAALSLISIESAATYNLHHRKDVGPMVAEGLAGWRLNDLFPSLGTETWTAGPIDIALLVAWTTLALLLIAFAWRRVSDARARSVAARRPDRARAGPDERRFAAEALPFVAPARLRDVFAVLTVVAAIGAGVQAARGESLDRHYLATAKTAREDALAAFARLPRCFVCYSSMAGARPPTDALGNEAGALAIRVDPPAPRAGERVKILVRPRSTTGEFLLATIRVDLGDGAVETARRHFEDLDLRHTYNQPGEYRIHAWATAASDRPVEADVTVRVGAPQ